MGGKAKDVVYLALLPWLLFRPSAAAAEAEAPTALRHNYYADVCPDVERIVRTAVEKKLNETTVTIPGVLRLFAHDCFVQGCDASIMIVSTAGNKAERDHEDNLPLTGDGFDAVVRIKAAVDAVAGCKNRVSCADIIVMATRDVVHLAGGPLYDVELGRLDGLISTAASVDGKLPQAYHNLTQLNAIFGALGLSQNDVIAVSGAHTVGFSHCSNFLKRIKNFDKSNEVDPSMNENYAGQLLELCKPNADSALVAPLDPVTPEKFDNQYYKNLQAGMGLLASDQILYTDSRSRATVDLWAQSPSVAAQNFVLAMTRMARVGVKTGTGQGNIRRDCTAFN